MRVSRKLERIGLPAGLSLALLVAVLLYIRFQGEATAQSSGAHGAAIAPVTAGTATAQDMPVYVRGIGTVQAYNNVTVKSRVDGQIVKVDFREGQEVKTGDPHTRLAKAIRCGCLTPGGRALPADPAASRQAHVGSAWDLRRSRVKLLTRPAGARV